MDQHNPVQPPSMQGAGVPSGPPPSILDTFGGYGSMPQDALQMLAGGGGSGPMAALAQGGNIGLAMQGVKPPPPMQGAGMGGQGMDMMKMFMQQQQHQQELQMRLKEKQMDREVAKNKELLQMSEVMLKSDSPEARMWGAKNIQDLGKKLGAPIGQDFTESFRSGAMTLDKRKEAYISILSGNQSGTPVSDDYLVKVLHVPKEMVPQLRQEAASDPVLKMLGMETVKEEKHRIFKEELEQRKYDAQVARDAARDAHMMWQEKHGDQQYQATLARIAQGDQRIAQADARLAQQAEIADRRLQLAEQNAERAQKKFEWMQSKGPEEKKQAALDHADLFTNQFSMVAEHLFEKKFLPPTGVTPLNPEYLKNIQVNRRAFGPTDPDWQQFTKHLKNDMVGYMRSVQNDIGPRAMAAFQAGLDLMDNPPDIESIRQIIGRMREAVKMARGGKDTAMTVTIRKPDGKKYIIPWKRGMIYLPGDSVVGVDE